MITTRRDSATVRKPFLHLILLLILLAANTNSYAQGCSCTNCPQFMPDNFVGGFLINVMGATNNTLGQNGQGVCGVNMSFDHEYLGDLSIVLTSPGGQSVTLVGPIGLFGSTDFTTWNIGFVPCGDTPTPDPGFSNQWSNNQPWGTFGNYTGTYYPSTGCLENFNSGPVNGTWTLTVTDGQGNDVGNFLNYEIIFCDPDGILCISCDADAGELTQNDVTACEGSGDLVLDLPPNYPPPTDAPPPADYGYTYVIGGTGGVIQAYDPTPDLTGLPPGNYTVCGFSYLLMQENNIPAPNGSLTVAQLNTQLESSQPPLCGDLSGNCVNVTILELPPDEEEFATICNPECYEFHNQFYCNSGTYIRNLETDDGCPYVATLYLTVIPPIIRNVNESICDGSCATLPGFEDFCDPGAYQVVFTSEVSGCDSIVNLNLIVLNPVANINPPAPLTCSQTTTLLSGSGSSIGGGVTYQWTTTGGHFVSGTSSINAVVDAPGEYQLKVCRTSGGISCCDSTEMTVISQQQIPAPPNAVVGPSVVCPGDTVTYTATTSSGATGYSWSVPAGANILSGQNTQSIEVLWSGVSGGNICASAVNLCGISNPTCLPVTIALSGAPALPSGDSVVCAGAVKVYSISPVPGATDYTWTVSGGTLVSGQGTISVIVNWSNISGTICVNASTLCGVSQNACEPVTVINIPASPVPAGALSACPGGTYNYISSAVPGAITYNWSVTGGTVSGGQGTPNTQIDWAGNATSGTVCVNAANTCGTSADSCLLVNLSTPVAGPINSICDGTGQFYTVTFPVSGGTPPYSVQGATVLSGICTSEPVPSGQSYSFVISDANGCTSPAISGSFNCNCTTDAGNMSLSQLSACTDQSVTATHLGGQNTDANDASAYFLHTNAGASLGTVYGQNTTGTFSFVAGMTPEVTYYISLVVGDNSNGLPSLQDPCLSVSQGQPVVFHGYPQANAGADTDTCGLGIQLNALAGTGTGIWTVVSMPPGGAINFISDQNPGSGASASSFGVYFLAWTLDNNNCKDTDTVTVDFNDNPALSNAVYDCDASNENYSVTFTANGGTPGYQVAGSVTATGSGNTFTSGFIPNGIAYSYTATDAAGCVSQPFNGSFSCDCATDAGFMDIAMLSACEGETVSALHLGGETLDGNDIAAYYLHSGSGNSLGTVYATNSTGVFGFQSGMTYGVTYYVSYVVGNDLSGLPDPADFCLAVAPGQAVVFYQNPVANAGADVNICGNSISLAATPVTGGSGIWTVISGNANDLSITSPADPASQVSSAGYSTYTLAWTVTRNGCTDTDQLVIQFNDAPVVAGLARTCDANNENYTVSFTLSGGTPPYTVNGVAVTGALFTSSPVISGDPYSFVVSDASGCQLPAVSGVFACACSTDAGSMQSQTITVCQGSSITAISNNDKTLDGNDAFGYVLHNGSGTALGQVFAQNTTGTFTFQNGMSYGQTYYVSAVAGNPLSGFPNPLDPCFSVAAGQPVVWLANPIPAAGADIAVCGTNTTLNASNSTFAGVWTQVAGPGISTIASTTAANSGVSASQNGIYTYRWTETNGACTAFDEVKVTYNSIPAATGTSEVCDGTNTSYTLSFTVLGGTPPYQAQGVAGSFTGSNFTSSLITSGSSYSFTVIDANGCVSTGVTGSETCECTTAAGSMITTPQVFCTTDPAVAIWNNDGNKDANDIIRFILHSDPGVGLGTVYATNTVPVFSFTAGLQTGVTYYISAIAGNNSGGNVSTSDPCLSIAIGTPVSWEALPNADAGIDHTIDCIISSAVLGGPGTTPGQYLWTENGNNVGNTSQITVQKGGVYTLKVSTSAGCTDTDDASVFQNDAPPVIHGITLLSPRCFGESNGSITIDSVSATTPVLYSLDGVEYQQSPVFDNLKAGTYTITILDENGCETTTSLLNLATPGQLDVSFPADLTVELSDTVLLTATCTLPLEALDTIIWSPLLDSSETRDPLTQQFVPLQSLRFFITVKDTNGCVSSDVMDVKVAKPRNIYIPNVFNPTAGQDPVLYIFGGRDVAEIESFQIFDRWGTLLFEQQYFQPNDERNGWDGKFRGSFLDPAVFVYQAKVRFIDGVEILFEGDITIVR
jgi:subtilisin-like proprotein convertase family protein